MAHYDPLYPVRPSRSRRFFAIMCWAYLAVSVGLWLLLYRVESWWPATMFMFSPRWVFALPLLVFVPLALYFRSWWIIVPTILTALVIGGPVTGFNVPWKGLATATPAGKPFRIITLNMHYARTDPGILDQFVEREQPDAICIQEWPGSEKSSFKSDPQWHVHSTQRLFLASRHPIRNVVKLGDHSMSEHASAARYELDTPLGPVHVFSMHLATMREGITDTIKKDREGPVEIQENSILRRAQAAYVAGKATGLTGPILMVGDLNTPPESPIFDDVWPDYTDAFRASGWGWGYTFTGSRTKVRIDHILAGPGWAIKDCRVGPYVGSPHRPVIANLVWPDESR